MVGSFTEIKGSYSEARRLPRLGKIRLGVKVLSLKSNREYPRETPWFVVPPEVEAVYGKEPKELDVMLPVEDKRLFFPQKLAMYGQSTGLKCHGNNETAKRLDDKGNWIDRGCPCEFLKTEENPGGACTEQSSLMVLLPKVSMGGCYQITTGSYHSTVSINSSLELILAFAGRLALVPLKLRRVPRVTHNDGKPQTHYTLELILDANLEMIRDLRLNARSIVIPASYQIEGPVDENKRLDPVDVTETEEGIDAEDLADMDDKTIKDLQHELRAKQAGVQTAAAKGLLPEQAKKPEPKQEPKKEPAKPAPVVEVDPVLISGDEWESIIYEIDFNPELVDIKDAWKKSNNVSNITRLQAKGQRLFLAHLKAEAAKRGIQVSF